MWTRASAAGLPHVDFVEKAFSVQHFLFEMLGFSSCVIVGLGASA